MMSADLRRVAVVLVDRANYGRLEPVMHALQARAEVKLLTVVGGTMVLQRFGRPMKVVEAAGFSVDAEVYQELEGSTPATMAKSIGFGVTEYANAYHRLSPDMVVLIGDRYEAFAAAIAAAYMNICMVHFQGGEVSGSIDESARHAITKLAHYHYPSTRRAREYLVQMGEDPQTILGVGCPSSDLANGLDRNFDPILINSQGAGATIDCTQPYILAVYHPTTTEYGSEIRQIDSLLSALRDVGKPTIMLWPNIDAGSDRIAKRIRIFRERTASEPFLRTVTNLEPSIYLKVLASAQCAVGNSSSFVRDASFFGTPVVLVGQRQAFRERGDHVRPVSVDRTAIAEALAIQLEHGRYPPSELYGNGHVADQAAKAIAVAQIYAQKSLHYVHRPQ
ncbi:MAG: UDP-N-acetylglucosamine 2-epimerase (hydrolyzing) [Myxococcales bacterium]|nr:UDP-N-acetylglucosamine 2-epimerase (hydrolyzing) [Myxococcales bacterium]